MWTATRCLLGLVTLLLGSAPAFGTTWTEVGDAGKLISTAQETGSGSLTGITTDLSSTTDIDLFKFFIAGPLEITITTSSGGANPQLFLFDASGQGVVASDDMSSSSSEAQISEALNTGYYYVGVSLFN